MPDLKSRAQSVAVLSLMGDTIGFQALNASFMDGGYTQNLHLDGANLDDAARHAVAETLMADVPGFALVFIDAPHDKLVADANGSLLSDGPLDHVRDDLALWRASHPVDLIVILVPTYGMIAVSGPKRAFFGMGVSGNQSVLFLRAVVLDGKSGEILSDLRARATHSFAGRSEEIFAHPTSASNAMMARVMRNMLEGTIPGLIQNVGL